MLDVKNMVKNIIRWGQKTLPDNDSYVDKIGQGQSLGKNIEYVVCYPYGMSANAPVDSTLLVLSPGGNSKQNAALEMMPENRPRDLKEWESIFGNFKTKCFLKFDEDGNMILKAGPDGGKFRYENKNGFFEMSSDGELNVNDNFRVKP